VPLVPALGVIVCGGMIVGLDRTTQLAALGWMIFGLVIYFLYAKGHSKLNSPDPESEAVRKVA
jgi:APA family basic amino acid/polyamine antiporter